MATKDEDLPKKTLEDENGEKDVEKQNPAENSKDDPDANEEDELTRALKKEAERPSPDITTSQRREPSPGFPSHGEHNDAGSLQRSEPKIDSELEKRRMAEDAEPVGEFPDKSP